MLPPSTPSPKFSPSNLVESRKNPVLNLVESRKNPILNLVESRKNAVLNLVESRFCLIFALISAIYKYGKNLRDKTSFQAQNLLQNAGLERGAQR